MRKDLGVQPAIFPMPVLMVAAYDENGTVNVMNAAWGMICGHDKIALFIDERHKTTKNIRTSKAFTVSLADKDHMDAADFYGIATGNKMPDKFVMQSSESVISVCFNSSLLKYGGDLAVGAMTILTSTMQFAMLPLQGIGQGAQPIMSYNYGARNIDRMKKTFKLHLVISLIYSTLFWLFVQLFPATFAGIFSSDPELVSFTAGALRIYCGAMFLFGIQLACQMTFVAIGYAVCSIIVAVVRKFVLLLPLIFIVPMFVSNKTMGVYMAEPIADAIAVTFTAILFSIQFRKALRKLEKA